MTSEETSCGPPLAETVSPAARVMIKLCHALNFYRIPTDNYDGTNLEGLSGHPLEELTISDLEKAVLLAAGFKRTPEFVRKQSGTLQQDPNGIWSICQEAGRISIDDLITKIFEPDTNIIGIRINPAQSKPNGTQPSRPFRKITHLYHPALHKDPQGHINGFYQRKTPDGEHVDLYQFKPQDTIEIFIEPKARTNVDDSPHAGGFVFQFLPDDTYQAYLTTGGVDVRHVHDNSTIQAHKQIHVSGDVNRNQQPNLIIRKFLRQDGPALLKLKKAVQQSYPNSEIILEAHYAFTDRGLLIYTFDMEIPAKIEAQWRHHNPLPSNQPSPKYNQEILTPYIEFIYRRFITNQRPGD